MIWIIVWGAVLAFTIVFTLALLVPTLWAFFWWLMGMWFLLSVLSFVLYVLWIVCMACIVGLRVGKRKGYWDANRD